MLQRVTCQSWTPIIEIGLLEARGRLKTQDETDAGTCAGADLLNVEEAFTPLWMYSPDKLIIWVPSVLHILNPKGQEGICLLKLASGQSEEIQMMCPFYQCDHAVP